MRAMTSNNQDTNIFYKMSLFLIIPFFGFYTVKLGFSPIYLTFAIAASALLLGLLYGFRPWQSGIENWVAILLLLYSIILYFAGWTYDGHASSAWFNLVFSLIYFLFVTLVVQNSNKGEVVRASELAIFFSLALLAIELIHRFLNPAAPDEIGLVDREDLFWYVYKTSSFMYPDSNSVGLYASCLFIFTHQLAQYYPERFKKYRLPIFLILLGSISRAAIISTIIIILFQYCRKSRLHIGIFVGVVTLAMLYGSVAVMQDESFQSKFWIASLVFEATSQINLETLLFGVGPGNAETVLSVGSHLLILTWLVETGFIGTILATTLWFFIYRKSKRALMPLIGVFVLNGLSFTSFAIPWLYSMAAILIFLSRDEIVKKRTASIHLDPSL